MVRRDVVRAVAAGLAAAFLSAAVWAAGGLDPKVVRRDAGPRVCLVRVDSGLDLPLSYASGFLLGEGRFVVTDLASVAQPGVKTVTVFLEDGTKAEASTFSMADPALGVVAIGVELPVTRAKGLALSSKAIPEGGAPAAVIGWKWGQELDVTAGMLKGTIAAAELAKGLKVTGEAPKVAFLTFLCPALDIATGAAVVDADGEVAGVVVRIAGADKPLVAPAPLVREALLAAGPGTKPLSALPNALWPVSLQVDPGRPPTPKDGAEAYRAVKTHSICPTCKGSGTVKVRVLAGYQTIMGMRRPIYRMEPRPCQNCQREGLVCGNGLYADYKAMASAVTGLTANPDTPDNARSAAFKNGTCLIETLAKVPPKYRDNLCDQMRADIDNTTGEFPRGAVFYAQVAETINIRGDAYTVLIPYESHALVMVNADRLTEAYSAEDSSTRPAPGDGAWLVVGGVLQGTAELQGARPMCMRLFGWAFGPGLGPRAKRRPFADERAPTPATGIASAPTTPVPATLPPTVRKRPQAPPPPRPARKPGEPNFFGL